MTTKVRDTPDTCCITIRPTGFSHPIWGIIIAFLLAIMLLVSYVNKDPMAKQTSSQAVTTQSAPHLGPSAAELIPVITGGAGDSTSLGGNSSLGGGSH